MSFAPVVPAPGFAGWRFLERTLARQEAAHAQNPAALRDEAAFRARIGQMRSADDLVADRQLLRVALTAFGLGDDLGNRAFVRQVLASDMTNPRSFANRLADKRYAEMARAFGFANPLGPTITRPGQAEGVLIRFRELRFEAAVGAKDDDMRLALALQRDLRRVAGQPMSEDARWFTVLGTPSLRQVFETAFNLPTAFGALDLDRQVQVLRDRTDRLTGRGDIAQFTDPGAMDRLIRRFFVGAQLAEGASTVSGNGALALLQAAARPLR